MHRLRKWFPCLLWAVAQSPALHAAVNDLDKALADLNEAIRLDANNAGAYFLRGKVYAAKEDYAKAKADLDRAIKLDPDLGKE